MAAVPALHRKEMTIFTTRERRLPRILLARLRDFNHVVRRKFPVWKELRLLYMIESYP